MVAEPGDGHYEEGEGGAQSQTQEENTEGDQLSYQRYPVHWRERGERSFMTYIKQYSHTAVGVWLTICMHISVIVLYISTVV